PIGGGLYYPYLTVSGSTGTFTFTGTTNPASGVFVFNADGFGDNYQVGGRTNEADFNMDLIAADNVFSSTALPPTPLNLASFPFEHDLTLYFHSGPVETVRYNVTSMTFAGAAAPVPEPGTMGLLGAGLAGFLIVRKHRRQR